MKLAIFDMDGLIFDTERLTKKIMTAKMAEQGYILTEDIYMETCGVNAKKNREILIREYGQDYPHDKIFNLVRDGITEDIKANGAPVKRGIPELLEYLTQSGIKCVVASSTKTVFVNEYLQISNLDKYFDAVIGGDMIKNSKPAPDIFLKACEAMDIEPCEAVVFEDSENGIRASVSAGIPVICIFDMKRHGQEIQDMCIGCFDDAHEVVDYFKNEI